MPLTDNPNDPRLGHGIDEEPTQQNKAYLILSDEERAKGFVRPYRASYRHVGKQGPQFPLRDATQEERDWHGEDYVKYEIYPESESPKVGRFWTQAQLDNIGKGCGTVTTMARELAETWARNNHFYGATFCAGCSRHLAVDEFVWEGTDERLGS